MGELGCGVLRMRTVRMRKKGDGEEGSSVGEEVVRERPSSTVGFLELVVFVRPALGIGDWGSGRTGGREGRFLDRSF